MAVDRRHIPLYGGGYRTETQQVISEDCGGKLIEADKGPVQSCQLVEMTATSRQFAEEGFEK